jgi:DNA polymerase III psi subunit
MDFWAAYREECLQNPWVVRPVDDSPEAAAFHEKVFVYAEELSEATATMLSKMVAALNYQPEQVSLCWGHLQTLEQLQQDSRSLKVVFFGNQFPGTMGEAVHWAGHQVVQTHALETLLHEPSLKKQTWSHLKKFAGLT